MINNIFGLLWLLVIHLDSKVIYCARIVNILLVNYIFYLIQRFLSDCRYDLVHVVVHLHDVHIKIQTFNVKSVVFRKDNAGVCYTRTRPV